MKERMKELGEAINETLANSDQIAEVISRIKAEGYDVFLVLEATVGFSEAGNEGAGPEANDEPELRLTIPELRVTPSDKRFLKSLRIAVDEQKSDRAGDKAA
jgi:hypothetical protein